jgi:hypothetical protein
MSEVKKNKFSRWAMLTALLVIVLPTISWAGFNLYIGYMSDGLCSKSSEKEVTSPDSIYIASVYDYNCGAVTSLNTFVSIRNSNQIFQKKFGINNDNSSRTVQIGKYNSSKVGIKWLSKDKLEITYPKNEKIEKLYRWQKIEIKYREQ